MANPITHEATDWKPLESGGTEITAARLNNMDGDITKLSNALGAALQVLSDGQDAATVAVPYKPCWLYDPKTAVMTYVAEDCTRTKPLASAADVKALQDSVSQTVFAGAVVDDLDSAADGVHTYESATKNRPPEAAAWGFVVQLSGSHWVVQLALGNFEASGVVAALRSRVDGVWGEWKHIARVAS